MRKSSSYILSTLLVLFLYSCQGEKQNLESVSGNVLKEEGILTSLRTEVNPLFAELENDKAGKKLDSLGRLLDENSTYGILCSFWRLKATYHIEKKQYDSAEFYLKKSYKLALAKDTIKKHIIGATIMFADLYEAKKDLPAALKYAKEAYAMADKTDSNTVSFICMRLCKVYLNMKDPELSQKYAKEGFRVSPHPGRKMSLATSISNYYVLKGKLDSALIFYKMYIFPDTTLKHPNYQALIHENYGLLLVKKGELKSGLSEQEAALSIYRKINMLDGETYFNLADTHHKLGQYAHSNRYLDSAQMLSHKENKEDNLKNIWSLRADNLKSLEQFKAAFIALDSSYTYYQKEVAASLVTQAREMETRYDVKVKDQKIELLTVSNAANHKIARQNKIIAITSTCLMILPIIVIFLLARRRKLKQQLKETELEQQLLRSQMEPHFIFNTLSVLQGLIRGGEKDRAVVYLNKFAGLLRLNLKNSRNGLVLLSEEMEALELYVSLQAIRFEGTFDYEITCYEDYEEDEIMIPPMLLQPFVENAIHHGLRNLSYKGKLRITVEKPQEHLICCKIEDNGCGLNIPRKAAEGNSLSTAITRERLAIFGKETKLQANLKITDRSNFGEKGTLVELVIPAP